MIIKQLDPCKLCIITISYWNIQTWTFPNRFFICFIYPWKPLPCQHCSIGLESILKVNTPYFKGWKATETIFAVAGKLLMPFVFVCRLLSKSETLVSDELPTLLLLQGLESYRRNCLAVFESRLVVSDYRICEPCFRGFMERPTGSIRDQPWAAR